MTHGDIPVGRSNSRGPGGPPGANNGNNGRQSPIMDSDCEDSSANTPMSAKMGKMMSVKVLMLDDSITVFQVQVSRISFFLTSFITSAHWGRSFPVLWFYDFFGQRTVQFEIFLKIRETTGKKKSNVTIKMILPKCVTPVAT